MNFDNMMMPGMDIPVQNPMHHMHHMHQMPMMFICIPIMQLPYCPPMMPQPMPPMQPLPPTPPTTPLPPLPVPPTPTPPPGSVIHVVRAGDTVFRIAQMYGSTIEAIVEANNLVNPDLIYPGQRLIVPILRG